MISIETDTRYIFPNRIPKESEKVNVLEIIRCEKERTSFE